MSKTSVNARLAMIQAFSEFMDSGSQSATVIFYEGVQPADTSVAADSNNAWSLWYFPNHASKKPRQLTLNYTQLTQVQLLRLAQLHGRVFLTVQVKLQQI